ncbi:MAG: hypothetical protein JO035_11440 [Betaproteobacteria bacterium]|nr:hypothetical protein [Betaproteobacteria bacterium]
MNISSFATAVLALCTFALPSAFAHEEDKATPPEVLGTVTFPNSCSKPVKAKLSRGIKLLHSFWYSEAEATFLSVLADDPSCSIAQWGLASILMSNPLAGIGATPKNAERAQAAIEAARASPAKTERERDYVEAVAAYYDDFSKHLERERQLARSAAYEKLAAKYPKDDEAQIFNALYLTSAQSPSDSSYAMALRAAGILERQFKKHPDHPGIAHYLIHSYDYPPIAAQGVPAARKYAKIAPSAPHALHMPSHIFTRVGYWTDSAATNARSFVSAVKGNEPGEAWHASDYRVYALLQLARDADAQKTYDQARTVTNIDPNRPYYPRASIPARLALERGDWKQAATLDPVQSKFSYTDALVYFARGLGAARSGDPAAAEKEIETLRKIHDELAEARNSYWASEVEVSGLAIRSWVDLARGDSALAEQRMRQAADIEDAHEKGPITPGRMLPARELLGDMLMELGRPADALKEYEKTRKREPNRFRGVYGAALAAEKSGDDATARRYYRQLLDMAGKGDARPELDHARAFIATSVRKS